MVNGTSRIRAKRLGQQCLATARGANQQDIGFLPAQPHPLYLSVVQALVVVVHRHAQHAFGHRLTDHVIVKHLANFARRRARLRLISGPLALGLFTDDVHAKLDTFIADETRSGLQSACGPRAGFCRKSCNRGCSCCRCQNYSPFEVPFGAQAAVSGLRPCRPFIHLCRQSRTATKRSTISKCREPGIDAGTTLSIPRHHPFCRGFRRSHRSDPSPWPLRAT